MRYKIIGDSCLDLTKEMRKDPCYSMIPLTLMVGERHFVDDETFDQKEFIKVVKEYPECPKSACPSPEMFKEAYCCEEENVFVITLSAALSGSYNSAVLAKSLYEEEYGKKNILVLDSKSASSGQLNIAMYIRELCDQGLEFDEICEKAAAYRDRMNTYFVLESLDTLKRTDALRGSRHFCHQVKHQAGHGCGQRHDHQAGPGQGDPEGPAAYGGDRREGSWDHKRQASGDRPLQRPGARPVHEGKALLHGRVQRGGHHRYLRVSTVYASDGGVILAL